VHVWIADLDEPSSDLAPMEALLSAYEIARAQRFVHRLDTRRYVAAHGVRRLLCGAYLGVDPGEVRFKAGTHGKPALEHPSTQLQLSDSVSGGLALIAFAMNLEIGVDVELKSADIDAFAIVSRNGTAAEREMFARLPPVERESGFYRWWTARESLVKAWGTGFSDSSDRFAVTFENPIEIFQGERESLLSSTWTVRSIEVGAAYAAALATESSVNVIKINRW
jgi:4'-phosphopantetheinyl transferase